MNDFTKEELETLISTINSVRIYTGIDNWDEELFNKLQSMIENYCEHEWENICCQCTLDKIYCHKCNKDMGCLKQRYENE